MEEKNNNLAKGKKEFVNPYNFVALEKECKRGPLEVFYKDGMTGYIECVIKLLTPLFIPNTSNDHALDEKLKQKSYDFFSYEDLTNKTAEEILESARTPIIPASEIRGVIRSIHEVIFNSCMSSIDLKQQLKRRCPIPKKPFLLTKAQGKWKLINCKKHDIKGDCIKKVKEKKWREGEEVYFGLDGRKVYAIQKTHKKGFSKGYLHIGEPRIDGSIDGRGRGFSIFQKKISCKHRSIQKESSSEVYFLENETIELFERILEEYDNEKINKKLVNKENRPEKLPYRIDIENGNDNDHFGYYLYKEYFNELKEQKEEYKYLPVYCEYKDIKDIDTHNIHLSPACIGREAYYNTILDILKQNGGYQPCEERDKICPSCALFGMVLKEKKQAIGSRIRFEDATLVEKEKFNKNWFIKKGSPIVLKELGEPKPGAAEFYTILPEEAKAREDYSNWTYDYINLKERNYKKKNLKNNELMIRGRKFYWHSQPKNFDIYQGNMNLSEMNQLIRPLNYKTPEKKDIEFKFRVYFENISETELEELKLALDFDEDCAYKIGRAKPYGFGSIKIKINRVVVREIESNTGKVLENELETTVKEDIKSKYSEKKGFKTLKIMLDWKNKFQNGMVQYPLGEDETIAEGKENRDASHIWFTENRGKNLMQPIFKNILPKPEEETQKRLYKLTKKQK